MRAAWMALVLLTGFNLLNYLDRYVMSGVLTPLQSELFLSDADAGWANSAFMLGYFFTAPLFGYWGDRVARRWLMLIGVVVWSLATAATGLVHSFAELFFIRMIVGAGEACFVTICPSWISDLFTSTKRNNALTFFYVAVPFGSALGFALGGYFAQANVWREAFYWAGLPGVVLALMLFALREPKRGEADGVAGEVVSHPTVTIPEIFQLLRLTKYNLLVWGYAAQAFATGAFGVWGPTFLYRVHNMPLGEASTLFGAILAGAGLVATFLGGMLASFLRKRTPSGYAWVMGGSMALSVPVCFFALLVGNATLSLVGLGFSIFLIFLPSGPITSQLFEIVPVHVRSSAMALCIFFMHLCGDFGSPALVGQVSDHTQSLQTAVLLLPMALLLGAVFWCVLIWKTRQPEELAV